MRNWQHDAPRIIAHIHATMPNCTPQELRKELRRHSAEFTGGTSWGKKVWAKHCRAYLAKLGVVDEAKPIEWPADIHFPFRSKPHG